MLMLSFSCRCTLIEEVNIVSMEDSVKIRSCDLIVIDHPSQSNRLGENESRADHVIH